MLSPVYLNIFRRSACSSFKSNTSPGKVGSSCQAGRFVLPKCWVSNSCFPAQCCYQIAPSKSFHTFAAKQHPKRCLFYGIISGHRWAKAQNLWPFHGKETCWVHRKVGKLCLAGHLPWLKLVRKRWLEIPETTATTRYLANVVQCPSSTNSIESMSFMGFDHG